MATRPYLLLLCLVGAKLRGAFSTLPVARLCFHIDVQYFATYLKMEHYSVYMRNILPSTAFVIGIPICVFWGFLSDRLGTRFGVCLGPLLWGLIPVGILAFWGPPTARLFAFMVEFTYFVTHICESLTPSAAVEKSDDVQTLPGSTRSVEEMPRSALLSSALPLAFFMRECTKGAQTHADTEASMHGYLR